MKLLDTNDGRVTITLDMQTASNQKKGYMGVGSRAIEESTFTHEIEYDDEGIFTFSCSKKL